MKDKRKITDVILLAAALVLAITEYAVLPERVAMQVGAAGNLQNFAPKWLAILLPFIMILPGLGLHFASGDKKWLTLAGIGILVSGLTLVINLV